MKPTASSQLAYIIMKTGKSLTLSKPLKFIN